MLFARNAVISHPETRPLITPVYIIGKVGKNVFLRLDKKGKAFVVEKKYLRVYSSRKRAQNAIDKLLEMKIALGDTAKIGDKVFVWVESYRGCVRKVIVGRKGGKILAKYEDMIGRKGKGNATSDHSPKDVFSTRHKFLSNYHIGRSSHPALRVKEKITNIK